MILLMAVGLERDIGLFGTVLARFVLKLNRCMSLFHENNPDIQYEAINAVNMFVNPERVGQWC